MFKETIGEIRDKVAELVNALPIFCSSDVSAFAEDVQKKLDELVEFREQLGKNMDELESQLDARDRRIKVLEDIIEHYRRTVEYNNNAFTKLFNDKKELSEEISKQAELIKKLENEINYYKESTKHDNDEISKLQDALKEKDERNCDIAQKDEQIEKLNKELAIARVSSQTRMSWEYTISRDEALKAINEAIKKLSEEKNRT